MTFIVAQFFALRYCFFAPDRAKKTHTDPAQNVEDVGFASFLGYGQRVTDLTCFMIGHRDTPESIIPELKQSVEQHITMYGVTEFIAGHYGAFDRMAARAVREAKLFRPYVKLILLLPYRSGDVVVRISFAQTDATLEDRLLSYLQRMTD